MMKLVFVNVQPFKFIHTNYYYEYCVICQNNIIRGTVSLLGESIFYEKYNENKLCI